MERSIPIRLVARLDIKAPNLIKGIHLEGVRVIGDPYQHAVRYYEQGADEILYIDAVASLYNRDSILELVRKTAHDVFVPVTVGGGIRTVDDVKAMLRAGADKVAINTAALKRPELISEVANKFGAQCMVLSIEAKRTTKGWEAFIDNGREETGVDVLSWASQAQQLGAGEILLTSVDQEGTRRGFDIELVRAVSQKVTIPVIASGGMGKSEHLEAVVNQGHADAVAMADVLHYKRLTFQELRTFCDEKKIPVRSL